MTNTKKSKSRGYYFDTEHGKYRAQITINGQRYHLGYFKNQTQAARAYKEAAASR